MDAQEQLLRDLIASGACPALNASLQQADPGSSSSSSAEQLAALPFPQLLAGLRGLPFTTYSGAYAAACLELLAAQRAGDTAAATPLAARLCGEVRRHACSTCSAQRHASLPRPSPRPCTLRACTFRAAGCLPPPGRVRSCRATGA